MNSVTAAGSPDRLERDAPDVGEGANSRWKLIVRNVFRQRSRNLLLGLLILFASFVIVYLSQFLAGVAQNFTTNLVALASGDVYVASKVERDVDRNLFDREYRYFHVPEAVRKVLAETPGVKSVNPRLEFLAKVATEIDSVPFNVMAFDLDGEPQLRRNFRFAEGRMVEKGKFEVVVPVDFARRNRIKVGDSIRLVANSVSKKVNLIDYTVSGLFSTVSLSAWFDNYVYLDVDMAHVLVDDKTAVTRLNVNLVPGTDPAPLAERLGVALAGSAGPTLEVSRWQDGSTMFAELTDAMGLSYLVVIVIITLMMAASLAFTTMLNVLERTREIATLGALGATPNGIRAILVGETLVLATFAALAGIAVAMLLFAVTASTGIPIGNKELSGFLGSSHFFPAFNPGGLVAGFVVPLVVAFAASVVFAHRASRLPIAQAMADR